MYFRRPILLLALLAPWTAEAFGSSHYLSQIEGGPAKKKPPATTTAASYAPGTTVPSDALAVGGGDSHLPPPPQGAEPPRGAGGGGSSSSYLDSLQQRDPVTAAADPAASYSVPLEPPAAAGGRFRRVRRWLGSPSEPVLSSSPPPQQQQQHQHQHQEQHPPAAPFAGPMAVAAVPGAPAGDYLASVAALSKRLPEYEATTSGERHDHWSHEHQSVDHRTANTVFVSSRAVPVAPVASSSSYGVPPGRPEPRDAAPHPFERIDAAHHHAPLMPPHSEPRVSSPSHHELWRHDTSHEERNAAQHSAPGIGTDDYRGYVSGSQAADHAPTYEAFHGDANLQFAPVQEPRPNSHYRSELSSTSTWGSSAESSPPSSSIEASMVEMHTRPTQDVPREPSAPALSSLAKSIQMSKKPIAPSSPEATLPVPQPTFQTPAFQSTPVAAHRGMGRLTDDSVENNSHSRYDQTAHSSREQRVSTVESSKRGEVGLNTVAGTVHKSTASHKPSSAGRNQPESKRRFATLADIGLVPPPEPAAPRESRPQSKSEKKFATLEDVGLLPPKPLELQQSETQLKQVKTPATLKDVGLVAPMPIIDTATEVIVEEKEAIDLSNNIDVKMAIAAPSTETVTRRRTLEERFNALVQTTRRVTRTTTVASQLTLASKETSRLHRAPASVMADISEKTIVQGDSLRTWSFSKPTVERIHVSLKTNGRPLNAEIDLWRGPEHVPFKVRVYGENGRERPFSAVIETPVGPNTLSIRNTGQLEFPLSANVVPEENNTPTSLPAARTATFESGPATIHGGALKTYVFDASVQSVQVLLKSDGLPINATIELMQGPSNSKQSVHVFSEEGSDRPFFMVIETPGNGNVVRVTNASPIEFPMQAQVEPYSIGQALDPIEPVISGDVVIPEDDDDSDNSGFLRQLSNYGKKRWLGRR